MSKITDERFDGAPYDDVLDVDGEPMKPTDLDERLRALGVKNTDADEQ